MILWKSKRKKKNENMYQYKNIAYLGILLGIVLCFSSILPEILYYNMLYSATWIDIHNQKGVVYNLVETIIYINYLYRMYINWYYYNGNKISKTYP